MNSSVINSSLSFNHSSSGSSPQLSDTKRLCTFGPAGFMFLFIEKSMNVAVGYPVNIMVMWLVAREKSDSSTSNYFIFSLALADAWFCLMIAISLIANFIILVSVTSVLNFTTGIINGSPLFLACICLDRYVAVVHPIVFTSIKDKKIRVAISMVAWGLVIANALCRSVLTTNSFIQLHTFIGLFLGSFTIMVYCNVSIIWSLRKSVLGKEKMHPKKKKALRTVQIYLGITVFHYLPAVFISLVSYFPHLLLNVNYCKIGVFIFSIKDYSCITQPLLYICLIKQLPWLNKLLCICCRSPSPEPHNVST